MSIVTHIGHVKRAIAWYHQDGLAFVIGRQTPWDNEQEPPVPTPDDTIEEVIGYKRVEQKVFVVEDELNGTYYYRGKKYRGITEEECRAEKCRWVLCITWLNYGELPTDVSYRQLGLVSNIVPAEGTAAGQYVFMPEELSNPGELEVLVNDVPTYRSDNRRERLAILVEF